MKDQTVVLSLLLLLVFVAGCQTKTIGEITKEICDDTCKLEKENYIIEVNAFLVQAHEITSKITNDWKSVTKEDLSKMASLKNEVSALKFPEDFELAHDYYQRAFNHYSEAVDHAVEANKQHALASNPSSMQSRNVLLSKVVDNIQEANRLLIYAEEEEKFATSLVSRT